MAKTRRQSTENIFSNKGSVQPQKKTAPKKEEKPVEPVIETEENSTVSVSEEAEVKEEVPAKEAVKPTEVTAEPVATKTEAAQTKPSNINNLFSKKKERGKQQTIYFRKDIYDFCENLATEHELGLSEVVNRLLETFLEEE